MNCCARRWLPLALVTWGLFGFSGRAAAQPRMPVLDLKGTQAFRNILHGSGLKPLEQIGDLENNEPKTWIIIFGQLDGLAEIDNKLPGGLNGYLDRGGAILVASDRSPSTPILDQEFKVVPTGAQVYNRNP